VSFENRVNLKTLKVQQYDDFLWVTMRGVQGGHASQQYFRFLDKFMRATQRPWHRLSDLSKWQVSLPEVKSSMIRHLNRELECGLAAEVIILPELHLGRWQIEQTIKQTNKPKVFYAVENIAEARETFTRLGVPMPDLPLITE